MATNGFVGHALLKMASGRFPGLDKRHGFFLSIENNQADRDNYHWKSLEEKEKKKQEVEDQVRRIFCVGAGNLE